MALTTTGLVRFRSGGAVGTGNLSVKGLWHYATNDDAATVEGAGYFNDMAKSMGVGDIIFASLDLDGTPVFKAYMVTANTGSVVTIAAQTTA